MSRDIQMPLALDEIAVPEGRRSINQQTVKRLAESIDKIGLRHPISVRRKGEGYVLVAGLHRMEAYRKLGHEHIPATISSFTNADARLWEIAENLHRADLSKLERDENVAEWVKLTEQVSRQIDAKPQGGRPEGGVRAASRELGIPEADARRAVHVASLSDEAKEAAREHGLDDNRSALLEAAKEPTPERQAAKILSFKDRAVSTKTWRDDFEKLWARGTDDDHRWARERIDAPVMDAGRFKT